MTYVYESPDGGDTVYRRAVGSSDRELHSISKSKQKWDQRVEEEMRWQKIIHAGKTNPALQEALDRARVIYELSNHD
jgi:hypothetical protein